MYVVSFLGVLFDLLRSTRCKSVEVIAFFDVGHFLADASQRPRVKNVSFFKLTFRNVS